MVRVTLGLGFKIAFCTIFVTAAAKTLSENNCDVPQGFNQRRLFFQALLSVRKVDYCAGKENFIDILSVFDEIVRYFVFYRVLHY